MKIWKKGYYEAMFAERAKTVQDYQLQIANAQEKIKELQAKCKHENYQVMFHSWRSGSLVPAKVCTSCSLNFGEPTPEESKKLWDAYNGQTKC